MTLLIGFGEENLYFVLELLYFSRSFYIQLNLRFAQLCLVSCVELTVGLLITETVIATFIYIYAYIHQRLGRFLNFY